VSTINRARTRAALRAKRGAPSGPAPSAVVSDVAASYPGGVLPVGTAEAALRYLFPEPSPYGDDPVKWVQERCGGFVWSKQVKILESVRDNKYTAVKACHGPGKSASAGFAGSWWIDTHDIGTAFLVTTAPSWPQVQTILWREIRRLHGRANLPGRITLDCQWYIGEHGKLEELIAMGRKPADYDEQAFQGIHARYILIIIDEACGVDIALWNAVLSLATNENARILAIGNPDDPSSYFASLFDGKADPDEDGINEMTGWNCITISAFDTPNFTGESIPPTLAQDLVSPDWVQERAKDWGVESPVYTSKVLGQFPDISDDYLITPAMMEIGYNTNWPGFEAGRYGCDIARLGQDQTVIYRNRGNQIRLDDEWGQLDTMRTAGKIGEKLSGPSLSRIPATIDSIGVGAGVLDRLRERAFDVIGFQGSERAFRPDRYQNRRAEVYWEFRQGLAAGFFDLDPDDVKLKAELTNIKYWINSAGQICVESKEDMHKRGMKSPNRADACVYSTIHRASPAEIARARLAVEQKSITGDLLTRVM
jgi:hypothetical protein